MTGDIKKKSERSADRRLISDRPQARLRGLVLLCAQIVVQDVKKFAVCRFGGQRIFGDAGQKSLVPMKIAVGDRCSHTVLHIIPGRVKMFCYINVKHLVDK